MPMEGELVPCLLTITMVAFRKYMVCKWILNSQLLGATGVLYIMVPYYSCDPQATFWNFEHLCQYIKCWSVMPINIHCSLFLIDFWCWCRWMCDTIVSDTREPHMSERTHVPWTSIFMIVVIIFLLLMMAILILAFFIVEILKMSVLMMIHNNLKKESVRRLVDATQVVLLLV